MTELRQRMDEDMLVRGMADRTRESYLWAVTGLATFYHRSPDQVSDGEVQAYLLHLIRDCRRRFRTGPFRRRGLFHGDGCAVDGLVTAWRCRVGWRDRRVP